MEDANVGCRSPWVHLDATLPVPDAGHGMCFASLDGRKRYITVHQPNKAPMERPVILPFSFDWAEPAAH